VDNDYEGRGLFKLKNRSSLKKLMNSYDDKGVESAKEKTTK
jgi:hypothetical protein